MTQSIEKSRCLPFYLCKRLFPRFNAKVNTCSKHFLKIYHGAQKSHNATILIDSSKRLHGFVLAAIPEIELHVLHLVRDARATVYSWTRKKEYQKEQNNVIYFPRYNPFFASILWCFDNISAELLGFQCKRYLRIRYEDFIQSPVVIIKKILSFIEEPQMPMPVFEGSRINLDVQHSLSGNPVRFKRGEHIIKSDYNWEKNLSLITQKAVVCISWPFLLRYGYFSQKKIL